MTVRRALVQNAGVIQEIASSDKLYGVFPVGTGTLVTLYVRGDGNDANDGSANDAAHAFLTPQAAFNYFIRNYNWAGQADSTQVYACLKLKLGSTAAYPALVVYAPTYVILEGDTVTPSNTTLDRLVQHSGSYVLGSSLKFQKAVNTTTAIDLASSTFECGAGLIFGSGYTTSHVACNYASTFFCYQNYTITSGSGAHIASYGGSTVEGSGTTITLTGTPAFTRAFIGADNSCNVWLPSVIYSGAATGKRFTASLLGSIYTGTSNLSYFPGNAIGTLDPFSNYDDYTNETLPLTWANRSTSGGPVLETISDYGVNLQVKFDGTRNTPNGVQVLYHKGDVTAVPADTTEDTIITITVPDKIMGLQSSIRIRGMFNQTNGANNKTWKVKWDNGGTPVLAINLVVTTTSNYDFEVIIQNRNSISSQRIDGYTNGAPHLQANASKNTDTSVTTIVITGQKAVSTDTMQLHHILAEIIP
jgi:hypothetical protein